MTSRPSGPHGLLLLDKPAGITSHDLVARTRRALGTRKVGHAGTLDPMATGLMLVGVGDATRLLTFLVGDDKTYEATVRLGIATSTEDADGEVVAVSPPEAVAAIGLERLRDAAAGLTGAIEQVPSAVSAIKIDGKRAYRRVRDGEEVELPARPVTIHELEVRDAAPARADDGAAVVDARLRVRCSSGTYVRALGRDLGAALGVGAHLTALRRTAVGPFDVARAADLEGDDPAAALLPVAELAAARFPVLRADAAQAVALRHGQRIEAPAGLADERGPVAAIDPDGALIGVVEIRGGRTRTLMNLPQREEDGA
ncbi:MAG: tRNA pseudouridine(55) synthase TruB [Microbacteriaceae bacterium]|nr:tRNA pseudouridine(55) synthase TruB [Microbacteriaceae bacterium]